MGLSKWGFDLNKDVIFSETAIPTVNAIGFQETKSSCQTGSVIQATNWKLVVRTEDLSARKRSQEPSQNWNIVCVEEWVKIIYIWTIHVNSFSMRRRHLEASVKKKKYFGRAHYYFFVPFDIVTHNAQSYFVGFNWIFWLPYCKYPMQCCPISRYFICSR